MIRGFAGEPSGVVMLVDAFTLRVLSSVCKMSELLEENVHLVENVTMKQNGEIGCRSKRPKNMVGMSGERVVCSCR